MCGSRIIYMISWKIVHLAIHELKRKPKLCKPENEHGMGRVDLIWTPLGPKNYIVRCPHLRGQIIHMYMKLGQCPDYKEVSSFQGCPLRRFPL